jgi:hypothetical protein
MFANFSQISLKITMSRLFKENPLIVFPIYSKNNDFFSIYFYFVFDITIFSAFFSPMLDIILLTSFYVTRFLITPTIFLGAFGTILLTRFYVTRCFMTHAIVSYDTHNHPLTLMATYFNLTIKSN